MKTSIRTEQGGLPKGGATDEVPVKLSGADYDVDWAAQSGSGGSTTGIENISEKFDDFTEANEVSDSGPGEFAIMTSGNFQMGNPSTSGIPGYSFTSQPDHAGIILLTQTGADLLGFFASENGSFGNGLLNFEDGFDIRLKLINDYSGINWQGNYQLVGVTDDIQILFDDDGNIKYNVGGGIVDTGLPIPLTNTWFDMVFRYDGTTLTLMIDGVTIYSGAATLVGRYGIVISVVEDTQLSSLGIDWVKTRYRNIPGGGSTGKLVGAGEATAKQYFNIQIPFTEAGESGEPVWALSGGEQGYAVIDIGNNAAGAYLNTEFLGFPSFLPTSDDAYRKFDRVKESIAETVAYIDPTEANACFLGFAVLAVATHPDFGNNVLSIGFLRDNSGNWYVKSATGAARTETPISAPANTAHVFRIEYDPANTEARFYIDGSLVETITTNLPTASTDVMGFMMRNDTSNGFEYATAPSFAFEI